MKRIKRLLYSDDPLVRVGFIVFGLLVGLLLSQVLIMFLR